MIRIRLDYLHHPLLSTACLLFFSLLAPIIFLRQWAPIRLIETRERQWLFAVVECVGFLWLCAVIESAVPLNIEHKKLILESGITFPLFTTAPVIGKFFEIIFQQVLIVVFIARLRLWGLNSRQIIKWFALVFFAIHVPLLFQFRQMAGYYLWPSLFGGPLMAYLITQYRPGWVASLGLHLMFYICVGLIVRLV
jgi:hypothetical protein